MFDPHRRTMELLPLACLCLVSCSAMTSADGNGPVVITVDEDSVAMLPCSLSTKQNIESKLFDWKKVGEKGEGKKDVFMYDAGSLRDSARSGQDQQFDGRVSHFRDGLKHGNASILITKTKVADSGDYTCDFLEPSQSLQPIQTSHIKLLVGASPKPIITTLDFSKDWSLLQCEVPGASPKPEVQWKDSDGNILPAEKPLVTERGGKFFITLNITVTKTDHYRCVSTQEEIKHQIYAETYAGPLNESSGESNTGLVIGVTVAAIAVALLIGGVVLQVVLVKRGVITYKKGPVSQTETTCPLKETGSP